MDIRNRIIIGNIIEYKNEDYVVINKQYNCGICSMQIDLVKIKEDRVFRFAKIYSLYDEEIEKLFIIR
jgi:hypothetical protein